MADKERSELGDSICTLIDHAKNGCEHSREQLLEELRSYLSLVAKSRMDATFQAKFGESDIVQQSMLVAVEKFDQFRGRSEQELRGWVNQILKNELRQNQRALRSEKRDMFRERSIRPANSNDSTSPPPTQLFDRELTPGTEALKKEGSEKVIAAMAQLVEEHRTVIQLRNWDKMSFPEIGKIMNRSPNAVTKLWYRALIQLRSLLEECDG